MVSRIVFGAVVDGLILRCLQFEKLGRPYAGLVTEGSTIFLRIIVYT